MSSDTDYIRKVLLVGDSGVGKTCLLSRFVEDYYSDEFIPTIGVEFRQRTIQLDGRSLNILVWDTAGMERFRSITRAFYRGANGVICVYDVTKKESFDHLERWLEQANTYDKDMSKLIVGNKCDLTSQRQVDYATAKKYADKLGIPLVETSAKNSANVEQAFVRLALDIQKRMFGRRMDNKPSIKLKSDGRYNNPRCCGGLLRE